ncbi:stalk domain-containing protein [Brevibacillus composti]|uniref:Copper amine oxidase N-terminal domain-containing protein n=1 Tax=Brevibacillus composti TaxID=2796470 RepID=A0A7T5JN39_9BACL|nr:copper amine oxidase N-terminal domain-containing protein [Brevibacillus composti]QQE73620.1 copper amine oxidase N-terminal domain-containing protein [Brevibacillus composti]
MNSACWKPSGRQSSWLPKTLRPYQAGDQAAFEKLGKLYEKAKLDGVKAFVDGVEPEFDVEPFIHGGRTLVPVRAISASLKADVKWDAETRSALITKGDTSITLYLDKKEALVNGETVELDTVPVLKNGRVFLPLRFVSEQLKANVKWQQEGKIVIIDELGEESTAAETEKDDETEENESLADKAASADRLTRIN